MKKAGASILGCGIVSLFALGLWVGLMALIAIPATWAWNQVSPTHTTWFVMWVILLVVTFIGNFIVQAARK